jgi:hypothetical protein
MKSLVLCFEYLIVCCLETPDIELIRCLNNGHPLGECQLLAFCQYVAIDNAAGPVYCQQAIRKFMCLYYVSVIVQGVGIVRKLNLNL